MSFSTTPVSVIPRRFAVYVCRQHSLRGFVPRRPGLGPISSRRQQPDRVPANPLFKVFPAVRLTADVRQSGGRSLAPHAQVPAVPSTLRQKHGVFPPISNFLGLTLRALMQHKVEEQVLCVVRVLQYPRDAFSCCRIVHTTVPSTLRWKLILVVQRRLGIAPERAMVGGCEETAARRGDSVEGSPANVDDRRTPSVSRGVLRRTCVKRRRRRRHEEQTKKQLVAGAHHCRHLASSVIKRSHLSKNDHRQSAYMYIT